MPVFAQVRSLETDNEDGRARPDFSGHLQKTVRFSPYGTFVVLSLSH